MDINGVINVYKEAGFTSHDVVAKMRGILHQKKIGHTGTLDPAAEGVLPVCIGRGTRLCSLLTDHDKVYETVLLLGVTTDTQDMTGEIIKECPVQIELQQIEECVHSFIGEQMQIPPMYSAKKVNGKKLYELAREGKEIERKPVPITIHDIQILSVELPRIKLSIHCSKGTYIRTICHDIGEKLGCGGSMEMLLRTRVGRFSLENALKLDEIQKYVEEEKIQDFVVSPEAVFQNYMEVISEKIGDKLLHNGNSISERMIGYPAHLCEEGTQVRMYDSQRKFIGLFEKKGDRFSPVKMFYSEGK